MKVQRVIVCAEYGRRTTPKNRKLPSGWKR